MTEVMHVFIVMCIIAYLFGGSDDKKKKKSRKRHTTWYDSLNAGDQAWLYDHYK